jgi:hypothetical protein
MPKGFNKEKSDKLKWVNAFYLKKNSTPKCDVLFSGDIVHD